MNGQTDGRMEGRVEGGMDEQASRWQMDKETGEHMDDPRDR